ncbi:ECs_2282 family putative zinc-binding protein [Duffyella gerundensis]|uniref:ECs_2282 family putative zinc-binding protein n=1 Tax=Duffyella gerundensis TaxID=1619313 RepID=UPI003AF36724
MCRIKFICRECGGRKFIFTTKNKNKRTTHGAVCARCGSPLTSKSLYPCLILITKKVD